MLILILILIKIPVDISPGIKDRVVLESDPIKPHTKQKIVCSNNCYVLSLFFSSSQLIKQGSPLTKLSFDNDIFQIVIKMIAAHIIIVPFHLLSHLSFYFFDFFKSKTHECLRKNTHV